VYVWVDTLKCCMNGNHQVFISTGVIETLCNCIHMDTTGQYGLKCCLTVEQRSLMQTIWNVLKLRLDALNYGPRVFTLVTCNAFCLFIARCNQTEILFIHLWELLSLVHCCEKLLYVYVVVHLVDCTHCTCTFAQTVF